MFRFAFFATDGDDWLPGTDGDDVIFGGKGNDTFAGTKGNDLLNGGEGVNQLDLTGKVEDYTFAGTRMVATRCPVRLKA